MNQIVMALQRQAGPIPEGAVLLSEKDAVRHQWQIISSWEPKSEVWPFRYALAVSALSGGGIAAYVNGHFRKKLRLAHHGRAITFLPNVIIPAIVSSMFHQNVMTDVMLMKTDCPVCIQIRSSAYQAFFGGIYPTFLAPVSTLLMAARYYTFPVPSIQSSPMDVVKLWAKITLPMKNFLLVAALGQALIGSSLAYFEIKSVIKLSQKLGHIEENLS
ncbi:hypothetical protein J437_LFUL016769 [Ladona fulva]|uniref:Transmembrane protein 126A n=1 Tax=Ladona fulva TaxID=123851 RepID=A0A8K0PD78_LADFU|nr:hypothetical protein J437_LFUL016769 [Ladona fulva]